MSTVFISSTSVDLKPYRKAAFQVLHNLHLSRVVMEDFDAGSRRPPLAECLARVRDSADALVVIVARRYGWVPSEDWPDIPESQQDKSITWLECIEAHLKGIPVIPLLLDENCDWPVDFTEASRASQISAFKRWLTRQFTVKHFASVESFQNHLTRAVDALKSDPGGGLDDLCPYVDWVAERARRAAAVPGRSWNRVYVPLQGREGVKTKSLEVVVQDHPRVLLAGSPGSGKSTFVMKYASDLAPRWTNTQQGLPVLLLAREFWDHVSRYCERNSPDAPASATSPRWISHFIATLAGDRGWNISVDLIENLLEQGRCTILMDGLDQPNAAAFEWISEVCRAYQRCRFLITGRTRAVLSSQLDAFTRVDLAPLDNARIRTFLLNRARVLEAQPDRAEHRARCLFDQLTAAPVTRRFARNPLLLTMMLNAPADRVMTTRAGFYGDVLGGMLNSLNGADFKPQHSSEPLDALQELAWAMQTSSPPKVHAPKRWAADVIYDAISARSMASAAAYLETLAAKTGILSLDGENLRFWHPTVQEFLAARKLAYSRASERARLLDSHLGQGAGADASRQVTLFLGELLEDDPAELSELLCRLIQKSETTASIAESAHFAAMVAALNRRVRSIPAGIQARAMKLLATFQSLLAEGKLQGIDLPLRLELSRAIASAGILDDNLRWIEIPAGSFDMGAQTKDSSAPRFDPDAHTTEQPVRRVEIECFAITRYPVTVAQYAAFMADGGYARPEFWEAGGAERWTSPLRWPEQLERRSQPVTGVSWYEAAAFCAWAGGRLPTEEEWERTAAGAEGRRFPWGNEVPDHTFANFDRTFGEIVPVGLFPEHASAEGVNDLAGNVWEWVASEYKPGRPDKTLRGGSYQNSWKFLRTSERIGSRPDQRYSNFGQTGFRCARQP